MIDKVQKYRDAAARGWTQAETARQLGVTREAVRSVANRHRIAFPPTPREMAATRKRRAATLAGVLTREEMAQELGVSKHRVSLIAKGMTVRKPKSRPKPIVDQIEVLAAQGLTVTEIARSLGIFASYVSRVKAKYGILFTADGRRSKRATA